MDIVYSISLDKLIEEFQLEELFMPIPASEIEIKNREVNRPGLALAGFFEVFEPTRIQLLGKAEYCYLSELEESVRIERIRAFFERSPVAAITTKGFTVDEVLLGLAREYSIPVLRTQEKTSPIMAALIASLNTHLATRITRHGVLVEVYGEGMLILGDSGIGKSETAIELVKRGHRLIADDAVEIKRLPPYGQSLLPSTKPTQKRSQKETKQALLFRVRFLSSKDSFRAVNAYLPRRKGIICPAFRGINTSRQGAALDGNYLPKQTFLTRPK